MNLNDFTELLGYAESPAYLSKPDFGRYPGYAHIFRRAEKECALRGVYTLGGAGNDTIIPVVYLCEAASEDDAAKLHKLVWNQNVVPFLLVSTPKTFRLYPGFKYDTKLGKSDTQAILKISKTANEVLENLSEFKAGAIDIGRIWEKWGREVSAETRVDRRLLNTFEKLKDRLEKEGLSRNMAHALIGKYVYLHYLRDRDILSDRKFEQWGLDSKSVFGRSATSKGFFSVVENLDNWLNGVLFPIREDGEDTPDIGHIQTVASAFAGDDPVSGQMHLDFKAYDFEHIPIETLSVVYQQFLHAEGRGRRQGAYYTPVHLVNFILDELDAKRPLRKGMRVFDPACGSGAFLVQCYRLMIERELTQKPENRLRPSELRDLLTKHVYGMDVDEDACGVTELSLTLTLLDYVEPPDLEKACYKNFKLPILRNQNIFHCKKGFFSPDRSFHENKPRKGFDWIVGNPPWKKLSDKSADESDQAALDWLKNNPKRYSVGDNQVAEAFAWEVTEYLSNGGLAGLLMPAASLVKAKGKYFRERFFGHMDVWCVVNFANLRHLLFEGAVNPAAAFFYSLPNDNETSRIITYAPFAVNQFARSGSKQIWTVTVDASEIREVLRNDAASGSGLPWKIAMWGSFRDRFLLKSLGKQFPSLAEFVENHDLDIHEGLQLRNENSKEAIEHIPEVIGKPELDMNMLHGCGKIFSFPAKALKPIEPERAYVRKRGGMKPLKVCRPPHIIVDAARRFAVFSEEFVVVPPRQLGIAGKSSDTNLLKALTLYMNSEFATYQQFLTSTFWGIERDRPDKDDLEGLPIPIDALSTKELKDWADLHDEIVKKERERANQFFQVGNENRLDMLLTRLNQMVNDLLKLRDSEKWLIGDLLSVRMKLNEGRTPVEATRAATHQEIWDYANILKTELDEFLDDEIRNQHTVSAYHTDQLAMVRIHHPENPPAGPVSVSKVDDADIEKEFLRLRQNLSYAKAQWMYFNRNLKCYEGRTTYFFKPIQRLSWLKSQAVFDAKEFIADKLK